MKRAGLIALVFVVILLVLSNYRHFSINYSRSEVEEEPAPQAAGVGSSFELPGLPTRLKIYSIGVDAIVQQVGLNKKGDGDPY